MFQDPQDGKYGSGEYGVIFSVADVRALALAPCSFFSYVSVDNKNLLIIPNSASHWSNISLICAKT